MCIFVFQHGTTDEVTSEEEEEEEMGEVRVFPCSQISQCMVYWILCDGMRVGNILAVQDIVLFFYLVHIFVSFHLLLHPLCFSSCVQTRSCQGFWASRGAIGPCSQRGCVVSSSTANMSSGAILYTDWNIKACVLAFSIHSYVHKRH